MWAGEEVASEDVWRAKDQRGCATVSGTAIHSEFTQILHRAADWAARKNTFRMSLFEVLLEG